MSLTVSMVLSLPGLESLRLRAGAAGLDNPVRWPYVAGNEGIADWVTGGEPVFVTGINHPRDGTNRLRLLSEAQLMCWRTEADRAQFATVLSQPNRSTA